MGVLVLVAIFNVEISRLSSRPSRLRVRLYPPCWNLTRSREGREGFQLGGDTRASRLRARAREV